MRARAAFVFVLCALAACAGKAAANSAVFPEQQFASGNEAYKRGRFEEAAARYQGILQSGQENGAVYYNLGNALLKSGRKGEAFWAYLKASRWMPGDADLNANLRYVRSALPASDGVSVKEPLALRWLSLNHAWPTDHLAAATCLLAWIALFAWLCAGWFPESRRASMPAVWAAGFFAALLGAALATQSHAFYASSSAVVIENNSSVRFSPQASGTVYFSLPEGAVIRVLTADNRWAQVRRADGKSGWLPLASLKAL